MRIQWRILTAIGALVCLLNATVEQSFARQTSTTRRQAETPKKEEKKTQAAPHKKKHIGAAAGKKRIIAKSAQKKTKAVDRKMRTKRAGVRAERRLTKIKPEGRLVARLERRYRPIRVVKRLYSAPTRIARQVEPIIVKDYQSILLADAISGRILLADEIDKQWPAASLTKMMVGLLALEDIARERFSLQTSVVISERATRARGRTIGLRAGEIFPLGELLQAMLVTSANDAAVAVAERIRGSVEACVAAMNRRAQGLDMIHTEFQTVNGMPLQDRRAGDFSSARDLVTLTRALLRHDLVLEWTSQDYVPFRGGLQMLPNTNRLVGRVDGVTGLKTGFTSRARYNLVATAQRGSLSLIAVVLGGKSSRVRFDAAAQYLEWGFTNYADRSVSSRESELSEPSPRPFQATITHPSLP